MHDVNTQSFQNFVIYFLDEHLGSLHILSDEAILAFGMEQMFSMEMQLLIVPPLMYLQVVCLLESYIRFFRYTPKVC